MLPPNFETIKLLPPELNFTYCLKKDTLFEDSQVYFHEEKNTFTQKCFAVLLSESLTELSCKKC